jgi:hypothetical protein
MANDAKGGKMKQTKVKQNEDKQIPTEVLADSIVAISDGIKKLRQGRLNDKALVLLIQHAAPSLGYNRKIGATEVRATLDGIESLEATFLKKKPN